MQLISLQVTTSQSLVVKFAENDACADNLYMGFTVRNVAKTNKNPKQNILSLEW